MTYTNRLVYRDDLCGYDGLFRFSEVFPTFEEWMTQINSYMFDFTIEDTEKDRKIFMILFNRYKGNFFRWKEIATIYSKMSVEYVALQKLILRSEAFRDLQDLTGTTTTTTNYKTNNTIDESDPENNLRYRNNITETHVDDSRLYIDMVERVTGIGDVINIWVNDLKKHFMNQTDEVVEIRGIYDK